MKFSRLSFVLCLGAILFLFVIKLPPIKVDASVPDMFMGRQSTADNSSPNTDSPEGSSVISSMSAPFPLSAVNGNKVASGFGGLHAVFASGNVIKYSTSVDGITWSSPESVASNGSHPTIAIAGTVIGVAYYSKSSGRILYTYKTKPPSQNWSSPMTIGYGEDPSIVSYQGRMHLTWTGGSSVLYVSFPAISTSINGADIEYVDQGPLCGVTTISSPTIAVIGTGEINLQPLVRVAYFYKFSPPIVPSPCANGLFGYIVAQRGSSSWSTVFGGTNPANTSTSAGVSLSIAANGYNGDFYVGVSYLFNGNGHTTLYYENAWNSNDSWRAADILSRESLLDVTASCTKFRIAVSDVTQGNNVYGPTWYRTGMWTGQTTAAPTWIENPFVSVSTLARDPQALFWSKQFLPTPSYTRDVNAVYNESSGSTYFVKNHLLEVNGLVFDLCPFVYLSITAFRYNSINRATFVTFRPDTGVWYIDLGLGLLRSVQFGVSTDIITPGDYDGDGLYDVAVFRPSNATWLILNSSNNSLTTKQFGTVGDIPTPADFDGDGSTDVAVYRPSNGTWYASGSAPWFSALQFGASGDLPVAGDFDGDAIADIAVFRPSTGSWYIMGSTDGFTAVPFGANGDRPAIGDYDGDGRIDIAVFRPSSGTWYLLRSMSGFIAQQFGSIDDLPVPADYDGDGKTDVAVFRPGNGNWYILQSSNGTFRAEHFGETGDIPIPSAYVRQ